LTIVNGGDFSRTPSLVSRVGVGIALGIRL
jgi:hypothetical protein